MDMRRVWSHDFTVCWIKMALVVICCPHYIKCDIDGIFCPLGFREVTCLSTMIFNLKNYNTASFCQVRNPPLLTAPYAPHKCTTTNCINSHMFFLLPIFTRAWSFSLKTGIHVQILWCFHSNIPCLLQLQLYFSCSHCFHERLLSELGFFYFCISLLNKSVYNSQPIE